MLIKIVDDYYDVDDDRHAVADIVIDVVVFEYPAVFGHHQVEWCAFGHLRWGWALNKFLFRQMGNYPYRLTWTHMEGMDKSHESFLFIGFQVRPREIEFRRFVQGPEEIYDLYNITRFAHLYQMIRHIFGGERQTNKIS